VVDNPLKAHATSAQGRPESNSDVEIGKKIYNTHALNSKDGALFKAFLESESGSTRIFLSNDKKKTLENSLNTTVQRLLSDDPEAVIDEVVHYVGESVSNLASRVRWAGMMLHEFPDQVDDLAKAVAYLEDLTRRGLLGSPLPELGPEAIAEIHATLKANRWVDRLRTDRRDAYEWVRDYLGDWVGKGLIQAHLTVDPELHKSFGQRYNRDDSVPKEMDVPQEAVAVLRAIIDPGERLRYVVSRFADARRMRSHRAKRLTTLSH